MKKLIIICLLFIDIVIIIMYVNLYRNYNSSNLELVNKLNGEDYEIFMNNNIGYGHDMNEGMITTDESKLQVWVIPTDEEIMIARDSFEIINKA